VLTTALTSGTVSRVPRTDAARQRPHLSAEAVLDAAMELVDTQGEAGLTFRRLGELLGADPTAVYRYFRSKDDLLLAMADRVFDDALGSTPPQPDWRSSLRVGALEAYHALLRHPRLAVLVAARTTQGRGEARAIESILAALDDAGLPPAEAVEVWRAFGDTVLAWAALSASFLALPTDVRDKDESAWTHTYPSLPADEYPHLAAAGPFLSSGPYDPFPVVVELLLDGVACRIAANTSRSTA
jgi:AcrR family transcriptional regulator